MQTDDNILYMHTEEAQSRTITLIGEAGMERLRRSRVLVAGVGGVGGYAAEMLARTGIGRLTIIDSDIVAPSNINRQIIALHSTIGKAKTDLFAARFADINPYIEVDARRCYLGAKDVETLLAEGYDFVLDAIDSVAPKAALIAECMKRGIPIISSMGAGGRTDASKVIYADIWDTRDDGLARAIRTRLKKLGMRKYHLPVVASTEAPHKASLIEVIAPGKRSSFGTMAAIPAIFGIMAAQYAINRLIHTDSHRQ